MTDGGFTSVEHIFPESLGNTTLVLPKGVVCDRCNSTSLAGLDEALCEFLPIQMFRVTKGIRTKSGKLPTARFQSARVETDGGGLVKILVNNPRDTWTFRETSRSTEEVRLRLTGSGGRRLTPDYVSRLSRAVLKSALECAWLDHGAVVLVGELITFATPSWVRPATGSSSCLVAANRPMTSC